LFPGTIRGVLEARATHAAAAVALLAPDRQPMEYSRLLAQVDSSRIALAQAGVRPGDRVAVVAPNGPEMAAAFLAISDIATCAPLNSAYRESEFHFYLSDLAAKAIVIAEGLESPALAAANQLGIPVIQMRPLLNQPAGSFALHSTQSLAGDLNLAAPPPSPPQPQDVALVLHTSGTTSRPKQVPLTHANLCCSSAHIGRALELTHADRCLNVMPLFHIHGLAAALLSSLAAGASLVCTPGFYAPQFLDWLAEFQPTWYTAVPTMHQAILMRAGDQRRSSSLRFIRSSSAPLAPQIMSRLESVFSVPVVEAYGMTEASHQMASNPLPPRKRKPGSVGIAAGPEIAIMNDGHPAPCGATGEIVIRGPNVMGGYAANPEANDAVFQSGWFRTGDLGWLDDENYLFISGRAKEIINSGGEKISPREIDEVLLQHPAVAQALAFSLPDHKLGEAPAAAVVLRAGMTAVEIELREFCSQRLADFKVPRRIVMLDEIPKGPTGKASRIGLSERLGLKAAEESKPDPGTRRAPETETEKLVAALWKQVLAHSEIRAEDDFFELGGDSMLAAQFLSRLVATRGSAPPLLHLFEHPTVEAFARRFDSTSASAPAPILAQHSADPAPLSFAQQRFWFLDQFEEDSRGSIQSFAVRLRGHLDVDKLQNAFERIISRHRVLRTSFEMREGTPIAVLRPMPEFELKTITVESEDAARRVALEEERCKFDLTQDLMIRAILVRIAPGDHVLLLARHHIACDGWSFDLLLRELAILYGNGNLPDAALQYNDFARWQIEQYQSGAFQDDLDYWKEKLAGSPSLLSLPLDRPRPARQSFHGARESFLLPEALFTALGELSRREGATLFMTLLAAFQALLHRYSGGEDILVGCPVASRGRIELEFVVGPLMNTLVMRTDFSGDLPIRGLLSQVRATALEALAHQHLPFDKLVDELQPARSLSHSPIFQVLFQLRNLPFESLRFDRLEAEPFELATGIAQFDLGMEIVPDGPVLRGALTYNTDLFDRQTALRLARHYRTLLEAMVRDPESSVSSVPLLDAGEQQQLLEEWNQTSRALPSECVHQMFEAEAARRPDSPALIDKHGTMSYADLNRAANAVAADLQRMGVHAGALVAVCVQRSSAMVVAILGVLKTGCAYLPLEPEDPQERLHFVLRDSGAAALITQSELVARFPQDAPPLLSIDSLPQPAPRHASSFANGLTLRAALNSTAYAIYTSGSTGVPKGVLAPHLALSNVLEALRQELGFSRTDVLLSVTTLSFDIAAAEIFLPLISGGALVIADRDQQTDGRALGELIERTRPTYLQATPATWRMLLDGGWNGSPALTAMCGGETMPRPLADALLKRCGRVFNLYGPTETTIWSTVQRVESGEGPVPIGRPLANTHVYVLDKHKNLVPQGATGTLYISGAGVAQGYLNRPELTNDRFVPDPFAALPGLKMYNTGDHTRWLPNGTLEYLGRSDNQVKLRGFRIELGEVEAALTAHKAVRAVAAAIREDALTAWYESDDASVRPDELRTFLTGRLPHYLLPSRLVPVEALPRLASGKIDRSGLLLVSEPVRPESNDIVPTDETAHRIASIWEALLGCGPVGQSDNFFQLGGHSLLAAQAASRISDTFGIRLPVAALFESPTVAGLAQYVRAKVPPRWKPGVVPIRPGGARTPFWLLGGSSSFRSVAEHLNPEQPILGVVLEDSDVTRFSPPYRLETIAAEMLRMVKEQQPQGPYQLGGHSRFGLFAFEAARQLVAAGEQVLLVAVFDTNLPAAVRLKFPIGIRLRVQLSALTWLLSRRPLRDAVRFLFNSVKDLSPRTLDPQPQPPSTSPLIEQILQIAASQYQPGTYSARLVYVQAADQPIALHLGSRLGWSELAEEGFDIHVVPGDHADFLSREQGIAVAKILDELLSKSARAAEASPETRRELIRQYPQECPASQ
jgi:amino acid adenylation domain-containing protein